jgi:hypothetical protein
MDRGRRGQRRRRKQWKSEHGKSEHGRQPSIRLVIIGLGPSDSNYPCRGVHEGGAIPVSLLVALACLVILPVGAMGSSVVLYDPPVTAQRSNEFSLTVNGQAVFVERFLDISYAHFGFSGPVKVVVTASERVRNHRISPQSRNIDSNVSGHNVSFTLSDPCKLVISINASEKLFLFADPIEEAPLPTGMNVINILDYGVDNTGSQLQTARIQDAIDDISASRCRPLLYFPPGIYLTGTLTIKSNVQIYLAAGALLQGSTNPADYLRDPEAGTTSLIRFVNAQNATLRGPGVIDARGTILRAGGTRSYLLSTNESDGIVIEGPILRDSSTWNTHIFRSDNVTVRNVKIINNVYRGRSDPNTDGINPDSSRRVRIEDVFMYTGDDNVAVKARNVGAVTRSCEDILVSNGVFLTLKSSLKVGTESTAPLRSITFENIDVLEADRAAALYLRDAGSIDGVYFDDIRVEKIAGESERRLIDIRITDRSSDPPRRLGRGSTIRNVRFRNFLVSESSPRPSRIHGLDHDRNVSDLLFDNLTIAGQVVYTPAQGGFDINRYVDEGTLQFTRTP